MKFYDYVTEFTRVYRETENAPAAIREARCVEVMSRYEFEDICPEDLLAGRLRVVPVGFSNEPLLGRSVGYFYDEARSMEALSAEHAAPEQIQEVRELLEYWKTQETRYRIRSSYPADIKEAMPEDIYWEHSEVAFPLYRVVGAYLDYDKLLRLGLCGMREEIREYLGRLGAEESHSLYEAMDMALGTLMEVCRAYAAGAEKAGKAELAGTLYHIADHRPETFLQGLQLSWLYSLISGVLNLGRMDDYMGDFLQADLEAGRLSESHALELLCSLWQLIAYRHTVFHGRVIIGGRGRHNEAAADRFAILAMEASRVVAEIEPQLSLRFYKGQNPALMEKALEVIGEGKIYPMLYNDEVNIPAVEKAFEVTRGEAEDYVFFGCGEYVINRKSFGSPNGIINLLKALELTLFNGYDIFDGKERGLKTGEFTEFNSYEDFYLAYRKQLYYYFEKLARQEQIEYEICAKTGAFLYMSMLYEDCIQRNKSFFDGGIRYLGGTLETYGNINTANSLYAIKKVVFEEHQISQETLLKALRADFKGYETERRILLSAEKYGNDLEGVDSVAVQLHDYVCRTVRDLKKLTTLHSYMIVIINNEANTILGRFTAASADGRRCGEPMANANNPTGGTDQNGVTAMLNSMVKLRTDLHAGAVQNMTFSKELFNEHRDILRSILKTYFDNGGQQAMINVLGKEDLENAMKEPEKYSRLMVRVGGFSARFVTLAPDVQREIASRTLY